MDHRMCGDAVVEDVRRRSDRWRLEGGWLLTAGFRWRVVWDDTA